MAAQPWSPATHQLFPYAARHRAADVLRIIYLLSAAGSGQHRVLDGHDCVVVGHPTHAAYDLSEERLLPKSPLLPREKGFQAIVPS